MAHPESPAYDPKLTPEEVSATISHLGVKKANTKVWQVAVLGFLAGMYISFGSHLFLVALEQGMGRVVAAACFSVGLVLVVIAGAELFTGNITMVVGALSRLYSPFRLLRNWTVVYLANMAGAVCVAWLVHQAGIFGTPDTPSSMGSMAMKVAEAKLAIPFWQAVIRGFFCNILVILAIIMSYFSKDVISKIVCIVLPIMTFVASGFEHSIANMYLIPAGLFAGGASFAEASGMFRNVLPVTIGNVLGGLFIMLVHPNRIRQIGMLLSGRPRSK